MKPEQELLLCCARTRVDDETAARIRLLVARGVDWDYLLRLAIIHRVMPLLCCGFRGVSPSDIPIDIHAQLQGVLRANTERNLSQMVILLSLLGILESKGIAAIAFKGPVLAYSDYGGLGLRQFVDLDILVHERDVSKTTDLLVSNALCPDFRLTEHQETAFVRFQHERTFVNSSNTLVVDLHWKLLPDDFSFEADQVCFWERTQRTNIDGRTLPTLSEEDKFLHACMNAGKDCWQNLVLICDIAELIRSHPEMDWTRIIDQACTQGKKQVLFIGLVLADRLLEARIPEEVLNKARGYSSVDVLSTQAENRFLWRQQGDVGKFDIVLFRLRILERFRDRLGLCLRSVVVPCVLDIKLLRLPKPLFPLYYLVRIIRLSVKYIRILPRVLFSRKNVS